MTNDFTTSATSALPSFDAEDLIIDQLLDAERYNEASVYNKPGFKPVHRELSQVPVRVSGTIPADLDGVYLRNGTNIQFEKSKARYHAFNGAGMLHQVQIAGGQATYSNVFIRTPAFEFERKVGREAYITFGELASGGKACVDKIQLIEKKKRRGQIPNLSTFESVQSSTSVQYHAGKIYCLNEAGYPFVLDAAKHDGKLVLTGNGHFETWDGQLRSPFSAHPKIDPQNGDFYSMTRDTAAAVVLSHLKQGQLHNHIVVHQQGGERGRMGYLHDYFVTENYLVFPDISLRFSESGFAGPAGSPWFFDTNYALRFGVLPRDFKTGDTVQWFETNRAASIWHVVNGWEQASASGGKELVLYAPAFDTYPSDLPIHTPEEPPAKLSKWVLDLQTGKISEDKVLLQHGYERPSLNLRFVGKKNRFAYLLDEERDGYMGKGVLKYDLLEEREVKYFDYGDFYGGEALFVPKANSQREDDGYLVELLMADNEAALVIIDATSMTELARLHLPQRVPFGVHACWLDSNQLAELIV